MARILPALLVLTALTLNSCGTETVRNNNSSLFGEEDTRPIAPLFLILGGRFSCKKSREYPDATSPYGIDMAPDFQAMREELKDLYRGKIVFIYTCFKISAARIYWINSRAPGQVSYGTLGDTVAAIRTEMAIVPDRQAVVVGHSYGGWLALKSILNLDERETKPIHSLFTIDPIDMTSCIEFDITGCRIGLGLAPTNLLSKIKSSTDRWINFYQTGDWLIRSARVPNADFNIRVDDSHIKIDSNPSVWKSIQRHLKNATRTEFF